MSCSLRVFVFTQQFLFYFALKLILKLNYFYLTRGRRPGTGHFRLSRWILHVKWQTLFFWQTNSWNILKINQIFENLKNKSNFWEFQIFENLELWSETHVAICFLKDAGFWLKQQFENLIYFYYQSVFGHAHAGFSARARNLLIFKNPARARVLHAKWRKNENFTGGVTGRP